MKASRKIRWRGEIASDKQWQSAVEAEKMAIRIVCLPRWRWRKTLAKPLVKYIDNALVGEGASKAKVTLLVGHDSNIASLLTAPDFKPYQLPGQYERTLSAANCCFSAGMTAPAIAI